MVKEGPFSLSSASPLCSAAALSSTSSSHFAHVTTQQDSVHLSFSNLGQKFGINMCLAYFCWLNMVSMAVKSVTMHTL